MTRQAHRAAILHCLDDPAIAGPEAFVALDDGLLVVEDGHVVACGTHDDIRPGLPETVDVIEHPDRWIVPGLVDAHVHFPQMEMIASPGRDLLDWLDRFTFPAERAFASPDHAARMAPAFVSALLAQGTTTALVFSSVHEHATECLFSAAADRGMRLAAGNVLMDRHAPADLCVPVQEAASASERLIRRWHGHDRLTYAVTPRFAPACSPEMLHLAARLRAETPGLLLQTHLAETEDEAALVGRLFPEATDYLDVYDRHGLVGQGSVFAHCIHCSDANYRRLAVAGAAIAFCPTSNLFLGSGLFPRHRAQAAGALVAMGSDVGAGTSLSLLATLAEAHKVGQLQGHPLEPAQALYLATLAGARALGMADRIGNFQAGHEADFLVVDPQATPIMAQRLGLAESWPERLFAFLTLADDRAITQVYLRGIAQF